MGDEDRQRWKDVLRGLMLLSTDVAASANAAGFCCYCCRLRDVCCSIPDAHTHTHTHTPTHTHTHTHTHTYWPHTHTHTHSSTQNHSTRQTQWEPPNREPPPPYAAAPPPYAIEAGSCIYVGKPPAFVPSAPAYDGEFSRLNRAVLLEP